MFTKYVDVSVHRIVRADRARVVQSARSPGHGLFKWVIGCLGFGFLLSSSNVNSVRCKLATGSPEVERSQTRTQLLTCMQYLRLYGNEWNDDDENDELERMWKEVVVT